MYARSTRAFLALLGVLLLVALGADPAAARRAHIVDLNDIAVNGPDGSPLGVTETRAAILHGAKRRGWHVQVDESGRIRLELRHPGVMNNSSGDWVVVDVLYRAGAFDLQYVESVGLRARDQGGSRTVRNSYVKWTNALIDAITWSGRALGADPTIDEPPAAGTQRAPALRRSVSLDDLPLPAKK